MISMTKPEFTDLADALLAKHSVVFCDEESQETRREVGSSGKELMCDVFSVEVSDLTLFLDGVKVGAISLKNEYDLSRECPIAVIVDFTECLEYLFG